MKLLAVVENFPPLCNAGSEYALHHTLRGLRDRYGVEPVVAITRPIMGAYQLEGIPVIRYDDCLDVPASLVVTQLYEPMHFARAQARRRGAPLVYFHHTEHNVPDAFDLVVFNSHYPVSRWQYRRRHVVFHPPVYPEEYVTPRGKRAVCVTRINMSPQKGAYLFWQLAELLPDHKFLGVEGGWGPQILENPHGGPLRNVEIRENTTDMRSIYAKTRILLMPSTTHETWGRVAIEAAASGIPTIASGIPALRESLADAGIHCRTDMVEDWVDTIRCLDDPKNYACHSNLALERSRQLHPDLSFDRLYKELCAVAGQ